MLVQHEVEDHVHPVALGPEILVDLVHGDVGFRQHHRLRAPPGQEVAQLGQVLVRVLLRLLVLGQAAVLDQERHGVEPEPRDAELEPEAHDLLELLPHLRDSRC